MPRWVFKKSRILIFVKSLVPKKILSKRNRPLSDGFVRHRKPGIQKVDMHIKTELPDENTSL